ncbi:YxiJ family protein [Paenibacillus sp. UNC499MF]|uniref:YxiJ family protein n=1 Tax=Paenibacillus sp. UNC499MF TaxID=1502751 RepID=UPI0008A03C34|nr:YxiJ family protein [Paenibacillus sp. UNC499MF]SEG75660.1 YxiJ-like protein [Paenibacillus sp. UNC499MF]
MLLYTTDLSRPIPYKDLELIKQDFALELSLLSEEACLNADFNDYCMAVAGTISCVINGSEENIPLRQMQLMKMHFFERFPSYNFIENKVSDYPAFQKELNSFEEARVLVLQYFIR